MRFRQDSLRAVVILAVSMATAQAAPTIIYSAKLYEHFEKAGFSSLELMDSARTVSISGIALNVGQSFSGKSILYAGTP